VMFLIDPNVISEARKWRPATGAVAR
jgi:hypothetical protein